MTPDLLWIFAGAAVAGFVQGVSGFAFSLVAMSIWVWVLDPKVATVAAIFGGMAGQWFQLCLLRRPVHWSRLWPYLLGGAAGIPLGLWLLPRLNLQAFQWVLGLTLVIFCPLMFFSQRMPSVQRGGRPADALAGVGGGVMTALGGFAGVVPTLWATMRGYPKDEQRAVIQNFNLAALTTTFVSLVAQGGVAPSLWWPSLWVIVPALIIPSVLGTRLYRGLSEQAFRRVVLALLTGAGVALLIKASLA